MHVLCSVNLKGPCQSERISIFLVKLKGSHILSIKGKNGIVYDNIMFFNTSQQEYCKVAKLQIKFSLLELLCFIMNVFHSFFMKKVA